MWTLKKQQWSNDLVALSDVTSLRGSLAAEQTPVDVGSFISVRKKRNYCIFLFLRTLSDLPIMLQSAIAVWTKSWTANWLNIQRSDTQIYIELNCVSALCFSLLLGGKLPKKHISYKVLLISHNWMQISI